MPQNTNTFDTKEKFQSSLHAPMSKYFSFLTLMFALISRVRAKLESGIDRIELHVWVWKTIAAICKIIEDEIRR